MKKLVKEFLNEAYQENDPFLDELYSAIEEKFDNNYSQNYNIQIDFDGEDENNITALLVKEEYNVDFEDSEERHPWVEISTIVNFVAKTIITTGNLSSKSGDIDEDADRDFRFDENTSAENIAQMIWDNHDEVAHDLENAGKQDYNDEDDNDDYNDYKVEDDNDDNEDDDEDDD